MRNVFLLISSFACGSLSKQMWRSAGKVDRDEQARDKVFRAARKIYPAVKPCQKEKIVNSFAKGVRIGSVTAGGFSLVFALKVIFRLFR